MVRAQLKIQQMAFMLMAIFIFFILAGIFYVMSQSTDLKRKAELSERNKAIELAENLVDTSEFSCGSYCVDGDRAMSIRKVSGYHGTDSIWKVSSISIRSVGNQSSIVCTEANYPNCNLINVYDKTTISGETTVYSFVSLCKRVKEKEYVEYKCELAKFIVGYEVKA